MIFPKLLCVFLFFVMYNSYLHEMYYGNEYKNVHPFFLSLTTTLGK